MKKSLTELKAIATLMKLGEGTTFYAKDIGFTSAHINALLSWSNVIIPTGNTREEFVKVGGFDEESAFYRKFPAKEWKVGPQINNRSFKCWFDRDVAEIHQLSAFLKESGF